MYIHVSGATSIVFIPYFWMRLRRVIPFVEVGYWAYHGRRYAL